MEISVMSVFDVCMFCYFSLLNLYMVFKQIIHSIVCFHLSCKIKGSLLRTCSRSLEKVERSQRILEVRVFLISVNDHNAYQPRVRRELAAPVAHFLIFRKVKEVILYFLEKNSVSVLPADLGFIPRSEL